MPSILVDSSVLVAFALHKSPDHALVASFMRQHTRALLIPEVVLVETMYNIKRLGGENSATAFGRFLLGSPQSPPFLSLTREDFERALVVMETYRSAKLDFVDCCLTALAEHLNITQIATLDRRDFAIIRPVHVPFLTLLP